MFANGGRTASKGVEILGQSRPSVEMGEQHNARIKYYTASVEETGKGAGDPGHGVMFNGNKVHWGAVAVDPRYIPLGTRMRIEGWGDQVFTAEDTGSAVRGWHVDVFWPGTREGAFQQNDLKGGTRTITLLGPGPAFTDRAPGTAPAQASVSVVEDPEMDQSRWVTLNLRAHDAEDRVAGMMISNNPQFTDAFEEPYAVSKKWTLAPGDGTKTVYARFKNALGGWSDTASTTVTLEERPPRGSVVVAPDPRIVLTAGLSGTPLATVGDQPKVIGHPAYRPLGPNLLRNSSLRLGPEDSLRDGKRAFARMAGRSSSRRPRAITAVLPCKAWRKQAAKSPTWCRRSSSNRNQIQPFRVDSGCRCFHDDR